MKKFLAIAVFALLAVTAQSQDATLPGWNVTLNGNFLNISNAPTNNGFASSEAVRIANTLDIRADQLNLATPAGGTMQLFRMEYRRLLSDFIKPNQYINTTSIEPFINAGGGIANSNIGTASANRPAFVIGAGFDYSVTGTGMFSIRPLDVSYVRASILQGGGQLIGNHLQLMSGIGVRLGSTTTMMKNKAMKMQLRAKYHMD